MTPTGTSYYPVQELPNILKQLTASEFRETILALCFPGNHDEGFIDEVFDIVKKLDSDRARPSHKGGLPMHLFDMHNEELELVLITVALQQESAYQRMLLILERIMTTKNKVQWG